MAVTSYPNASLAASAPRPSRWRTAVLWTLQIGLVGMFLMAGTMKVSGAPQMVATFDAIGLGQWFRYVTGGIEIVAAVMLLVPRLAVFGALLLVPTMIGAVATHLFIVGGPAAPALVLLVIAVLVLWLRRAELVGLASRVGARQPVQAR